MQTLGDWISCLMLRNTNLLLCKSISERVKKMMNIVIVSLHGAQRRYPPMMRRSGCEEIRAVIEGTWELPFIASMKG